MSNKNIKINIASYGGRNWLLETARELDLLGYDVRFYSYLPTFRAKKFGLKGRLNASYFIISIPFLICMYLAKRSFFSIYIFQVVFDYFTAYFMRPCDVFIGQSPMHLKSMKVAKNKYGAKVFLERGTRHVVEQVKALSGNPNLNGRQFMPDYIISRDSKGYNFADLIVVPSQIVKESFVDNGISGDKIFVNNFGVNLKSFKPTKLNSQNNYDLIIVGQWSYRKGCDILVNVCRKNNFSLIHVGSIVDLEFPKNDPLFHHIDAVDQSKLIDFYSMGRVFVLPSREEGLALVQVQAVACGLPIVCSKFTGGRDLRKYVDNEYFIVEFEDFSEAELYNCIVNALNMASLQKNYRNYASNLEEHLSWKEYARRYSKVIENLIN